MSGIPDIYDETPPGMLDDGTLDIVEDVADFDPDQPRNPQGEWVAGPTSFAGSSAAQGEEGPTRYTLEVDAMRDRSIPISWQQRQALDMYTENSSIFKTEGGLPITNAETDQLDSLISQFRTPRDLVLHRNVGWSYWNEKLEASVGRDFTDPNYMSATLDPDYKLRKGNDIEIHVPKGTVAMPVGSLSGFPEEAEVLFPRGTRMHMESAAPLGPSSMKFVARVRHAE